MNGQSCDGQLIGKRVNFLTKPPAKGYVRCTGVPVCKVVSGCVHEHVVAWDACPDCARQVMVQIRDEKAEPMCVRCSSGTNPHTCPVMVPVPVQAATMTSASS